MVHADHVIEKLTLKPCPFCKDIKVSVQGSPGATPPMNWFYCKRCHASGPVSETVDGAAIKWNERR